MAYAWEAQNERNHHLKKKKRISRKKNFVDIDVVVSKTEKNNKQTKKMEKTKKRLTHTHTQKGFDDGDEGDDDGGGGGG